MATLPVPVLDGALPHLQEATDDHNTAKDERLTKEQFAGLQLRKYLRSYAMNKWQAEKGLQFDTDTETKEAQLESEIGSRD